MSRRRTGLLLAIGAAAVVAGGRLAPGSPPLYDSIGVPSPYRYVCLPDGVPADRHPLPDPASRTVPVANGKLPSVEVTTDEQPIPQVQLYLGDDALELPAGATSVTITITAVTPPQALPTDGVLDGNVYDIEVTSGGQPVKKRASALATVVLLGPPTGRQATVEQVVDGAWKKLAQQEPVGNADIFGAGADTFGPFALVLPGTPQTHSAAGCLAGTATAGPGAGSSAAATTSDAGAGGGGGGGIPAAAIVGVVAAVALLTTAGAVVARRRRPPPPPTRDGRARARRPPPRH